MHKFLVFWMLWAVTACSQTPASKPNSKDFSGPKLLGEVTAPGLGELSGMVASIANKDLLWVHNDGQNPAEIFLIDRNASVKLTCRFTSIENRDWEDIAVGPGPDPKKSYIYLGEIGDNLAQYQHKIIHRFEEPVLEGGVTEINIDNTDKIVVQLPDQKKDTETLLFDVPSGDLYIISKRENPVVVYRVPRVSPATDTVTAEPVITLPFGQIVGGDFSADGTELLLKNYENVFYWSREAGESLVKMLSRDPQVLPYEKEPQGEAIAFARDGSGYFTVSEKPKSERSFVRFYERK